MPLPFSGTGIRRRRYWLNLTLFALVLFLAVGVISALTLARSRAVRIVHPDRSQARRSPDTFGLIYQDLTLTTLDGLRLMAWYIPPVNQESAIIYLHGYGSNRGELLDQAAILCEAGYGALLLDLRAHGDSEGDISTLGVLEVADVQAAVDFLTVQPEINPDQIGIVGMSMGAVTAIRSAARIPEIDAVAAEASFTSLEENLEYTVKAFTGLPPFPFAPLVVFFGELEAGVQIGELKPIEDIALITPRPVLFVHGAQDSTIPVENSERLYAAAQEPKELVIIPNAGHGGFIYADPAGFSAKLVSFFDEAFEVPSSLDPSKILPAKRITTDANSS